MGTIATILEGPAASWGPESVLDERRLVARVMRHWSDMTSSAGFPTRDQIDPWLVGDDWASCTLISLRPRLTDSTFVVVGDKLLPSAETDLAGRVIGDCPPEALLGRMMAYLPRLAEERVGLVIEGATVHLGAPVLFRGILLPLAADGASIDTVLGAANYRLERPAS